MKNLRRTLQMKKFLAEHCVRNISKLRKKF